MHYGKCEISDEIITKKYLSTKWNWWPLKNAISTCIFQVMERVNKFSYPQQHAIEFNENWARYQDTVPAISSDMWDIKIHGEQERYEEKVHTLGTAARLLNTFISIIVTVSRRRGILWENNCSAAELDAGFYFHMF